MIKKTVNVCIPNAGISVIGDSYNGHISTTLVIRKELFGIVSNGDSPDMVLRTGALTRDNLLELAAGINAIVDMIDDEPVDM